MERKKGSSRLPFCLKRGIYLDAAEAAADAAGADAIAEADAAFFFIGADAAGADAAAAAGADAIADAEALAEAGAAAIADADAFAEAEGAAVCEPAKAEAANKPVTKTAISFFIFNPLKFELLSKTNRFT